MLLFYLDYLFDLIWFDLILVYFNAIPNACHQVTENNY